MFQHILKIHDIYIEQFQLEHQFIFCNIELKIFLFLQEILKYQMSRKFDKFELVKFKKFIGIKFQYCSSYDVIPKIWIKEWNTTSQTALWPSPPLDVKYLASSQSPAGQEGVWKAYKIKVLCQASKLYLIFVKYAIICEQFHSTIFHKCTNVSLTNLDCSYT